MCHSNFSPKARWRSWYGGRSKMGARDYVIMWKVLSPLPVRTKAKFICVFRYFLLPAHCCAHIFCLSANEPPKYIAIYCRCIGAFPFNSKGCCAKVISSSRHILFNRMTNAVSGWGLTHHTEYGISNVWSTKEKRFDILIYLEKWSWRNI